MVLIALVALAGCTGGGASNDSLSAGAVAGDVGGERAASPAQDAGVAGASRAIVRTRAVIRTGEISLTSTDLTRVRREVDDLLTAMDGTVDKDRTSYTEDGTPERSTLVLRVPVDVFGAARKALERLGKLESSDTNEKDVTTQVIDVDERVQTLQTSLDRLQRFQRSAQDVADLLRFEDQITARQAELQSTKAQQAYLADQTSLSTITLHLSTPDKVVPPPDALRNAGFLSGLRHGWHALGDFVVVTLTVLGAVLPFVLAGAVLGVPAWLALRAMLRRRVPTDAPPAASEGSV